MIQKKFLLGSVALSAALLVTSAFGSAAYAKEDESKSKAKSIFSKYFLKAPDVTTADFVANYFFNIPTHVVSEIPGVKGLVKPVTDKLKSDVQSDKSHGAPANNYFNIGVPATKGTDNQKK